MCRLFEIKRRLPIVRRSKMLDLITGSIQSRLRVHIAPRSPLQSNARQRLEPVLDNASPVADATSRIFSRLRGFYPLSNLFYRKSPPAFPRQTQSADWTLAVARC